jgi:glycosyltransferase involved in cell wall biosynthesis
MPVPKLLFDVRTNHDTGVSRFGLTTLAAAAPFLAEAGWSQVAIAEAHQVERAEAAVVGTNAAVLRAPEMEGFVRRSPWLRSVIAEESPDLYFTSHYTLDRHCPVPYMFTIHDLTRLRFPRFSYTDASFAERFGHAELALIRDELCALRDWDESVGRDEQTFTRYFRALTRFLAVRAERVVTVSATSAGDIEAILDVDQSRLSLVPCMVDTQVFHRQDTARVHAVRERLGVTGPFLLFVGLTHPNKRFAWMLEQLLEHRYLLPAGARLVAVGGYAEQAPGVTELLSYYGAGDFAIFPGRVSDQDLAALYSGAVALVSASISEGSNLPPQEAMACQCPVIATDIPTHRETLQGAATLYAAERGEQLAYLVAEAFRGSLPNQAATYRPPAADMVGQLFLDAVNQAIGASTAVR